jgi:hypothetical protein
MSIVINLAVAGLVVLVPNNMAHPSLTTAYLIDDAHHARSLVLYGSIVRGDFPASAFNCKQEYISSDKSKVTCQLPKKTEISIQATVEEGSPFLPLSPDRSTPATKEDAAEKKWLLHISNVDSGIRGIDGSSIEKRAGAKMSFYWEDMRSCALDGEEKKVYEEIGFKNNNMKSDFKQAVAESVLFSFSIQPSLLRVVLSRKGENVTETQLINISCFAPGCLSMALENSAGCDEGEDPGAHFARYYEVVKHAQGTEMLPFRVSGEYEKCPKIDNNKDFSIRLSLLYCELKLYSAANLKLAALGATFLQNKRMRGEVRWKEVSEFLSPAINAEEIELLRSSLERDKRQVMNRVICPPVVMSP